MTPEPAVSAARYAALASGVLFSDLRALWGALAARLRRFPGGRAGACNPAVGPLAAAPVAEIHGNGTTTSVFNHPHERGPSLLPNPDRTRPGGQGEDSLGGAKSCATAVTKVAHVCGIEPRPFPVSGFQYSAREEEAADRQLAS